MAGKSLINISGKQVEEMIKLCKDNKCGSHHSHNGGCAVYGLGVAGALIYYITNATTFQEGAVGIVKAILWPAFFVYQLLNKFPF